MAKKINIKGVIIPNDHKRIYDWFEMESTCPNDVSKTIDDANGEDVEIVINSGGGDVFSGSEIYTVLKDYKGNKTVKIVGVAASAASIIAMAGDKVLISPTAQIMIHNVRARGSGDYRDFEHTADVLKNYNKSIANAYRLKTGLSEKELLELMDKESWFTAQEAIEYKLADEIMFDNQMQLVASVASMIPLEIINKMRSMLKNPNIDMNNDSDILIQQSKAKLNLLKLKGEMINE